MATFPYVNKGNKYARDVIAGRIPACEWVQLAAKRHIDGLRESKKDNYPYVFDKNAGERVCRFIQMLPHTKGKWAHQKTTIALEPWQCFVVAQIFGWRSKTTGRRKYREVYLEVPRKNGKSILAAAIGLYMFCADDEYGAEVLSGATTEKQAWEVFRPARLMAARTPALREHYGIDVNAKNMACAEDGSRFEPMIGNPGDGASPSCALIDEYHEHQKPDLYDTMITGMGARDQPLTLVITTAGANVGGPCYEKRGIAQRVLQGVLDDDQLFSIIYTLDSGDDWTQPEAIRKANPNIGVSVSEEFLHAQVKRAIQSPTQQSTVKTKHFNMWVGAKNAWVNMEQWAQCADETLKIEDFAGEPCVLAIDLATRIDIAAAVQVFYREQPDGQVHYFGFPTFWLPEAALESSKNAQRFLGWASQGLIKIIDGAEIDLNQIQAHIIGEDDDDTAALVHRYHLAEIAYDPWQASQMAQSMSGQGARVVEWRNTVKNMSPAMKELEGAINSGRFHFDGNPILTWMASNVVAAANAKEEVYPRKEQPENKIDGMVALIMGIGRAYYAQQSRSAYESDKLMVV
jgi:phage terminase large subunit-like protein